MTLFFLSLFPILSSGCSALVPTVLSQSTQAAQNGCHQSSAFSFQHSLIFPLFSPTLTSLFHRQSN